MSDIKIFAEAKDGKRFDAESEEVKKYLEQFPDATLEVALGSAVMEYEKTLPAEEVVEESPAEEVAEEVTEAEGVDQPVAEEEVKAEA